MSNDKLKYGLDDVTPAIARAAKNMLDNEDFAMLVSTKVGSLRNDVLNSPGGDALAEAHSEYAALMAFVEWVESASGEA